MTNYKITKESIFEVTNGGLDVFRFYIPDIDQYTNSKKHFADPGRAEKTPSSLIKKLSDNNYVVNDFGDDGKWLNAIAYVQKREHCEYGEAIRLIAERHGIGTENDIKSMFEPDVSTSDAAPDQNDKEWIFNHAEEVAENHLRIIFSERTWTYIENQHRSLKEDERKEMVLKHFRQILKAQHWHALDSYTIIKNRKAITFKSTEFYPIFRIEEEGKSGERFSKIYQPKSKDKSKRFFYHGKFDAQFLHGFAQTQKAYQDLVAKQEKDEDEEDKKVKPQLDEIIYCTGGSDALNFYALGYHVVYPSSEHFKLTKDQIFKLFLWSKGVFTCPDLDYTGQLQNHRLCMSLVSDQCLDIRTIELPEELKLKRDQYGRPCKDGRDFLKHFKASDFANLVKVAKMYRFWDYELAYDRSGKPKFKYGRPLYEYKLSIERVINFLVRAGFGRRKVNEETMEFIQIDENIVRPVRSEDIKAFLLNFLRGRYANEDLLNVIHKSTNLSSNTFDSLPVLDPDFRDFDQKSQYMFFQNVTWKITAEGIEEIPNNKVEKMVWESKILPHKVRKPETIFEVSKVDGKYHIDIKNQNSMFFRFLMQTSRVHWQKELEDNLADLSLEEAQKYKDENKFTVFGPNLTEEERYDQTLHLINKMYAFGYLMHRYKAESRPWVVFGMDDTPQKEQGSFGGTGKSIFFKGIRAVKNLLLFDGKNAKLFEDNHVFEQVNINTDVVYIDDASREFPMERTFSMTTGDITVNPKGKTRISIPFEQSPKLGITTNFSPDDLGSSTMRRILFFGTSNYYHVDKSGIFLENRQPIDEFGKEFWSAAYTESDWNDDLNFMAQCCRLYLSWPTWIEAPMGNIMDRSLTNNMGFNFLSWAEIFFSKEANRLDSFVSAHYALEDFKADSGLKVMTSHGFNGKMKLYAQLKGYKLNPKPTQNKDGRVLKTIEELKYDSREKKWIKTERRKTQSMIYLQTQDQELTDNIYDPTIDPSDFPIPVPGTEKPNF
ncbi:hypothetical protein GCM10022216_14290 [Sphingobacterium kyonggiense]|uniref:Uncharacterized protein n=1 Tax=Sphingobacterium kyonggiense TaxID=714075 RepID=A0ABP7YL93_9SPHI